MLRLPTRPLTEKIDWWGLILMNAGAVAIVLMATWGGNEYAWTSPVIIILGVAGLICWGLFAFVESRAADPILPWPILINRTFVISTIVGMLAMGGMIGVLSYLPTYLQMVYGYSAPPPVSSWCPSPWACSPPRSSPASWSPATAVTASTRWWAA